MMPIGRPKEMGIYCINREGENDVLATVPSFAHSLNTTTYILTSIRLPKTVGMFRAQWGLEM